MLAVYLLLARKYQTSMRTFATCVVAVCVLSAFVVMKQNNIFPTDERRALFEHTFSGNVAACGPVNDQFAFHLALQEIYINNTPIQDTILTILQRVQIWVSIIEIYRCQLSL